jgi:hypothetical protein
MTNSGAYYIYFSTKKPVEPNIICLTYSLKLRNNIYQNNTINDKLIHLTPLNPMNYAIKTYELFADNFYIEDKT